MSHHAGECEHEPQTLHEFVLALLTEPAARSAFADDPVAALDAAGLSDVTAQDVQEVVPLVLDHVQLPATDVPSVPAADVPSVPAADAPRADLADLPAAPSLGDTEAAIHQLHAIAQAGADRVGLEQFQFAVTGDGGADGFSMAGGYDSERLDTAGSVTAGADGASGALAADLPRHGMLTGSVDGGGDGVAGAGGVLSDVGSVAGAADVDTSGGTVGGAVEFQRIDQSMAVSAGTNGVTIDDGSGSGLGQFAFAGSGDQDSFSGEGSYRGDHASGEGSVSGDHDGASGGATFEGAAPSAGLVDHADLLDLDALDRGGEGAGGALATYMASDGQAFSGALPADLPTPGVPEGLPETAGHGDLSSGLGQPIQLKDVGMPETGLGLPVDLPKDLPEQVSGVLSADQLPAELPALPELPVVNPLPEPTDLRADLENGISSSPLGDAVSQSPLGGLENLGKDLSVPQSADDLDLGH
ncbi:IniB N-terminal domain-containing protein [Amycolatopsis arida]|nr:IniB N-terminal domain-containing protein [Amycolatopsis arida]